MEEIGRKELEASLSAAVSGRKELEASLSALTAQPSTTMEHPLAQQQLPSLSYAVQPPSSQPSSRSSFTQASSQPPNQP